MGGGSREGVEAFDVEGLRMAQRRNKINWITNCDIRERCGNR